MKSKRVARRLLLVAAVIMAATLTLAALQQEQGKAPEAGAAGPVDPLTLIQTLPGYRANPLGHQFDTIEGLPMSMVGTPPPKLEMEFVEILPGTFRMGCSEGDTKCDSMEKPAHSVQITRSFAIGKFEVTQKQWKSVMGNNPSIFKSGTAVEDETRPVDNVSWNDVQDFLRKLNAREDGIQYRLPTETEWECAARAGNLGSGAENLDDRAWYGGEKADRQTHPVGQKQPNAWGIYDMQGNVWEWVEDRFGVYREGALVDSKGPEKGESHVLRGGAWTSYWEFVRVSYRSRLSPAMRVSSVGFRVVREQILREVGPAGQEPADPMP